MTNDIRVVRNKRPAVMEDESVEYDRSRCAFMTIYYDHVKVTAHNIVTSECLYYYTMIMEEDLIEDTDYNTHYPSPGSTTGNTCILQYGSLKGI